MTAGDTVFKSENGTAKSTRVPYATIIRTCLWNVAIGVIFSGALGACSQLRVSQGLESGAFVADTLRNDDRITAHIRRFNATDMNGRSTGSIGFARAATYVSEQFASSGLTPLSQNGYLSLYTTKINSPGAVSLSRITHDSVRVAIGDGMLGLGFSQADTVRSRRFILDPEADVDLREFAVIIQNQILGRAQLESFVRRGATFVLRSGSITMDSGSDPIPGLVAAQVEQGILDEILGKSLIPGEPYDAPYEIELKTSSISQVSSSALNIFALIPGSNPTLRNEVIVLAASLDGFGRPGGVSLTDGSDMGVSAAALLESARVLAGIQRLQKVMDRSVLLVLLSGSKVSGTGVSAFLDYPPWSQSMFHSFIYISNGLDDVEEIRQKLNQEGIDFRAIRPSETRLLSYPIEREQLLNVSNLALETGLLADLSIRAVKEASTWTH